MMKNNLTNICAIADLASGTNYGLYVDEMLLSVITTMAEAKNQGVNINIHADFKHRTIFCEEEIDESDVPTEFVDFANCCEETGVDETAAILDIENGMKSVLEEMIDRCENIISIDDLEDEN